MSHVEPNPDLFARYGVQRAARSYRTRSFRLCAFVQLVEPPEGGGDFCAVFLKPLWFTDEDTPLLVALISSDMQENRVCSPDDMRTWLRAHCPWNFPAQEMPEQQEASTSKVT